MINIIKLTLMNWVTVIGTVCTILGGLFAFCKWGIPYLRYKPHIRILEFYVYKFETAKKYVYKLLFSNRTRNTIYINDIKLLINKTTYNKYFDSENLQITIPPHEDETIYLDFPKLPLDSKESTAKFAIYTDKKIFKTSKLKHPSVN